MKAKLWREGKKWFVSTIGEHASQVSASHISLEVRNEMSGLLVGGMGPKAALNHMRFDLLKRGEHPKQAPTYLQLQNTKRRVQYAQSQGVGKINTVSFGGHRI